MDHIAVDTATSFPTSPSGNNVLLVVVCVYTRFAFLRAMPDKTAASVAANLFAIFADFGFPRIIQSDNGTEFVNQLLDFLTKHTGIDHRLSTPYHPRGNGLAERFVQTSTRAIKKLLDTESHNWDRYVPIVQLFINAKVASVHESAPFSVMFGRRLNPFDNYSEVDSKSLEVDYQYVKNRVSWFTDVLFPAINSKNMSHASRAIAHFAKTKRILKEPFGVGSYVMVVDPTRSSKTQPYYEGPYQVLKKTRGGSYQLLDSDRTLYPRPVAPSQMKIVSRKSQDDADAFVVDKILSHRGPTNRREYLVRWKGFDSSEDSWEPYTNFIDQQVISDYWSNLKAKSSQGPV